MARRLPPIPENCYVVPCAQFGIDEARMAAQARSAARSTVIALPPDPLRGPPGTAIVFLG